MIPIYCASHGKEHGAKPQTSICSCGRYRPTYGNKDALRPSHCKSCKTENMITLRNNNCKECNVRASYGLIGGKMDYCASHKKVDMIDLSNKFCEEKDCKTLALYGTEYKKPRFCTKHKKDGMFDIKHKMCEHKGCNARASFGTEWNKAKLCALHKTESMENVVTKRCIHKGCAAVPTFGLKKGIATHCDVHKLSDMIDVKHLLCKSEGCKKRPYYGFEKYKPICCKEHKQENMIDVSSNMCANADCKIRANFGFIGKRATKCNIHKTTDMIDVGHEHLRCPGPPGQKGADGRCPLEQRGTAKYDGFCTTCFPIAFPTDPRTFTIKKNSDELIVRDFLSINFPELGFVHDTPLWTHNCDCTHRRRIDLRTIINGTMLAIEIDEHQHKYKDAKDEILRYDDVYMLYSGKWIFIRYNPHTFLDKEEKRKNPKKELRLAVLKETIQKHIERVNKHENSGLIEIEKLYFDGFSV